MAESSELPARTGAWQVHVLFGDSNVAVEGPVKFGIMQVTDGDDGLSEPSVPLIYGPVSVRSHGNWLCVETHDPHIIHREMTTLQVSFEWHDAVRVEGFECRKDGTLVQAVWEIEPYRAED